MRKKLFLVTGLLFVAALLSAFSSGTDVMTVSQQGTGPETPPRQLNVTGTGKAFVTPDVA